MAADRISAHIWIYGVVGGVLIAVLKAIEYRWLAVQHSVEIYGGLVAAVFAALGLWLGTRLTRPAAPAIGREAIAPAATMPAAAAFARDEAQVRALGLTPREIEILELIAEGLSTREMAARLFVSENTVKTHASRVFDKLDARRRTQAVQRARERQLIP